MQLTIGNTYIFAHNRQYLYLRSGSGRILRKKRQLVDIEKEDTIGESYYLRMNALKEKEKDSIGDDSSN